LYNSDPLCARRENEDCLRSPYQANYVLDEPEQIDIPASRQKSLQVTK
jgi:hypothetical protein